MRILLRVFVLTALIACSDESSTSLARDAGADGGNVVSCSCSSPGATVEIVGQCSWGDATECSGFHSAACAQMTQALDAGIESCTFTDDSVVASGTSFTGYGCTLRLVCAPAQ